jgi:hypothetical protein
LDNQDESDQVTRESSYEKINQVNSFDEAGKVMSDGTCIFSHLVIIISAARPYLVVATCYFSKIVVLIQSKR